MRPARSSSYLRGSLCRATGESRTRTDPVPGECSTSELQWRWWTRRDSNPQISRVRAGCASVALRAQTFFPSWGDRRESNPHSGSHRPVRCPYATTTVILAAVRPEGIEPSSTAYRAAALPLCYGRRIERRAGDSNPQTHVVGHPLSRRAPGTCAGRTLQISRGGRDRTCDLTVPNRARCRCATPRWLLWRKERESNPQGSSLIRFRDGCHHPLACPSRNVLRRGSGGNRTHVLRFKRPVQLQHLLPTRSNRLPHPSESNRDLPCFGRTRRPPTPEWEDGGSGEPPRPQLCSCQRGELKLGVPDPGVEPRCHGSEPCVLPLDQSGSASRRAARARLPFERSVPLASGAPGS
jgi:hypothetical protein